MDPLEYEIIALSEDNNSRFQRFFRRKRFDIVLDSVLSISKKGDRILELGCGIGAHSLELARRGFDVTAVDINKKFIDYAKDQARKMRLKNVRFIQKDITKPLNLGIYDVILTSEAIEHITNFRDVFRNIKKSLKHGGYVVLTVPNHAGMGEFTEFLWALKARYNWVEQHYGYCCSTKRIENVLMESGLRPLKTYTPFYISHFLPFLSSKLADFVFDKENSYLSWFKFGTIIISISKNDLQ